MTSARFISSLSGSDGASAAPARRPHVGRLLLPRAIAPLTPSEKPPLADVDAFVYRLVELPFSEWLAIGQSVVSDRSGIPVRRSAWALVDAAITKQGLAVAAWYVRDAVDTAAFLVSRRVPSWPRDGRRMFAAAHGAAEAAALALLARAHMSLESLSILCAPFGNPLDELRHRAPTQQPVTSQRRSRSR
jgi:hypothetical protein